jgi:hypothetical protein
MLHGRSPFLPFANSKILAHFFSRCSLLRSPQYGLVPYLKEDGVTLVFGEAIGIWKDRKWERGMEVTDEMVNEVHALYIRKLKELFEKEKKGMGYGDRTLFIE